MVKIGFKRRVEGRGKERRRHTIANNTCSSQSCAANISDGKLAAVGGANEVEIG